MNIRSLGLVACKHSQKSVSSVGSVGEQTGSNRRRHLTIFFSLYPLVHIYLQTHEHKYEQFSQTQEKRQYFFFWFFKIGFLFVALELILELALVDQAGLKLTEICLPLPPKCWN